MWKIKIKHSDCPYRQKHMGMNAMCKLRSDVAKYGRNQRCTQNNCPLINQ
jgi:hypothetical protein